MTPFIFEQILVEKIWGGSWLKSLNPNCYYEKVGEAIILGDENNCKNKNIIWNKKTKLELFNSHSSPIMVKLLDAKQDLSVQVHPLRGENVKTEAWYVIEAEEGAQIIYGLKGNFEDFKKALKENGDVEPFLNKVNVYTGDFVYLPSGTVHALGRGIKVLEIQQNSNITYRLHDYGRGREIHIREGIKSIDKKINYNTPHIIRNVKRHNFNLGTYMVKGYFRDYIYPGYGLNKQYAIVVSLENTVRYSIGNNKFNHPPYTAALLPQIPEICKAEGNGQFVMFLIEKMEQSSQGVGVG